MPEHTTTQQKDTPFCRWQVRIHDSGQDYCSPQFDTYAEMREWEAAWYKRNKR